MKSLVIALVAVALLVPAIGSAQDRITINADFLGGDLVSRFSYPLDQTLQSGKQYGTAGAGISAEVRLTRLISAGYRFERGQLHDAINFYDTALPSRMISDRDADTLFHDGHSVYQEFYGRIELPKTHGHAFLVGFSKNDMVRNSQWHEQGGIGAFTLQTHFKGLVVGGAGQQRIKRLSLDYAGRFYPHQSGTDGFSLFGFDSSAFEGRGTVGWQVQKHLTVSAGYQFRRQHIDSTLTGTNGQPWPIHENLDNGGRLILGTAFRF